MLHWIFPSLATALIAATLFYQRHGKFSAYLSAINLSTAAVLLALGSGSITEIVAEWSSGKVSMRRVEDAARSVEVTKAEVDRIAANIAITAKQLRREMRRQRRLSADLAGLLVSHFRELLPPPVAGGQWPPRTYEEQRAMSDLHFRTINKLMEHAYTDPKQRARAIERFGHAGGLFLIPEESPSPAQTP